MKSSSGEVAGAAGMQKCSTYSCHLIPLTSSSSLFTGAWWKLAQKINKIKTVHGAFFSLKSFKSPGISSRKLPHHDESWYLKGTGWCLP